MKQVIFYLAFIIFLVINQNLTAQEKSLYMSETFNDVRLFMKTAEETNFRYETVFFAGDILKTRKMQYQELEPYTKYLIAIIPDKRLEKVSLIIKNAEGKTPIQISYEESAIGSNFCIAEINTLNMRHFVFQIDALRFKEGFNSCHYGWIIIKVNSDY